MSNILFSQKELEYIEYSLGAINSDPFCNIDSVLAEINSLALQISSLNERLIDAKLRHKKIEDEKIMIKSLKEKIKAVNV